MRLRDLRRLLRGLQLRDRELREEVPRLRRLDARPRRLRLRMRLRLRWLLGSRPSPRAVVGVSQVSGSPDVPATRPPARAPDTSSAPVTARAACGRAGAAVDRATGGAAGTAGTCGPGGSAGEGTGGAGSAGAAAAAECTMCMSGKPINSNMSPPSRVNSSCARLTVAARFISDALSFIRCSSSRDCS